MSDASSDNQVLSSFYLSRDMDRRLGNLAFRQERSRDELVREILAAGLEKLQADDPRFASTKFAFKQKPVAVQPLRAKVVKASTAKPAEKDVARSGERKSADKKRGNSLLADSIGHR